jgi:hypothetical protein
VDARGASLLAARIRAGVRVGARIELVEVRDTSSSLQVGDLGVVREIVEDGRVIVIWERSGLTERIDPDVIRYRIAA